MNNAVVERIGRLEFTRGSLAGQEVILGMAGVGKVNAAMCTEAMILKYAPELIVNSGVAGSLSPRFSIGDIGFVKLEDLAYSAVNEEYINEFSAPELSRLIPEPTRTSDL